MNRSSSGSGRRSWDRARSARSMRRPNLPRSAPTRRSTEPRSTRRHLSPLARVGPSVTVLSGYRVLPGANVTTDAQASNPKLGMVVPVTSSDMSTVKQTLSENESLTVGYSQLYQGARPPGPAPALPQPSPGFITATSRTYSGPARNPVRRRRRSSRRRARRISCGQMAA